MTSTVSPAGAPQFLPIDTFRLKPLIYVVDSYNPDTFGWTREINSGIITGFRKGGLIRGTNFEIVHDTLDAYINSSPDSLAAQGERILNDIRKVKPDLVLTTDDDALVWVGLKITDIPVVFNGVNGDPARYLSSPRIDSIAKPGHNITGVFQTTYFQQSLALIKQLVPSAKTFGVITDTTTTGTILLESLKHVESNSLPMKWKDTFISDHFPLWKKKLKAWEGQIDAVFLLSANAVYDESGELMTSDQAVGWMTEHCRLPKTASWAYQVKSGILAAATDDGVQQGELSAMLAMKIFQGSNPGDLSISTPPNGVPALNLARAKSLNITVPRELIALLVDQGVIF